MLPRRKHVGASTVSAPVKAAPRAARCSRDDRARLGRHRRLPGRGVPDRRDRVRARGDDRGHLPAACISRPGCSHAATEVRAADTDPLPDRDGAAAWRLRLVSFGGGPPLLRPVLGLLPRCARPRSARSLKRACHGPSPAGAGLGMRRFGCGWSSPGQRHPAVPAVGDDQGAAEADEDQAQQAAGADARVAPVEAGGRRRVDDLDDRHVGGAKVPRPRPWSTASGVRRSVPVVVVAGVPASTASGYVADPAIRTPSRFAAFRNGSASAYCQ